MVQRMFWDDCGAWNSKDGQVTTKHYVRDDKILHVVNVQDG